MPPLPQFRARKDMTTIRRFSKRVRNLAKDLDLRRAAGHLRFENLDPEERRTYTIYGEDDCPGITVRLDREANTSDGAANLQIQVNDSALARIHRNEHEGTTIAQVLVPGAVYRAAFACPERRNACAHLENIVRSALLQSADSGGFPFTIVPS